MNDERPIEMPYIALEINLEKSLRKLTDEQRSRFLFAIFAYGRNEAVDLSDDLALDLIFDRFVSFTEKYRKEYISKVKRNRENGKKGGRPRKNQETQENPKNPVVFLETHGNPKNQKKTKVNKTKQNVSVSKDTDTYSTKASQSVCPEGQPTAKPEYRELRVFAREVLKLDNAYFCDDFSESISQSGGDWSDWQAKMTAFAEEHKNEWSYDG